LGRRQIGLGLGNLIVRLGFHELQIRLRLLHLRRRLLLAVLVITYLNHGLWPCDPKSFQRCMVYVGIWA
jgi:hypothetical protein